MRITCPDCKNAVLLDDADAGREVDCPRCRGTIRVPKLDDSLQWDHALERPWGGRGVTSLVFGLLSLPMACCGLGVAIGLGALGGIGVLSGMTAVIFGVISFRTPSRGAAIAGAVFGVVGVILSLGVLAVIVTLQSAANRPVPPAADGTPPPFAEKF